MLEWIMNHGAEISTAILAAHGLAVAIVNMTDTPKDDAVVAKLYKIVEMVAGVLNPKKIKQ